MNRIRVMSDNPDHVSVGDYVVRGGDNVSVGYLVGCGDQNSGGDFVCGEVESELEQRPAKQLIRLRCWCSLQHWTMK